MSVLIADHILVVANQTVRLCEVTLESKLDPSRRFSIIAANHAKCEICDIRLAVLQPISKSDTITQFDDLKKMLRTLYE